MSFKAKGEIIRITVNSIFVKKSEMIYCGTDA